MKTAALALTALAFALIPTTADAGAAARKPGHRRAPASPVVWTKRVTLTPDGGFLVGNPAAKVKLVEYGSLSCPYCQKFYADAHAALDDRIATGRVAFEFHPFAVHSADPILHALLRCAGPARFRGFFDDFMQGQETLAAAYETWAQANPQTNPNLTAASRIQYAREWGFTAFAAAHGVPAARVAPCVSDTAALSAQSAREDAAGKLGVDGTPTFFLDGQKLPTADWPEVDRVIAAALG